MPSNKKKKQQAQTVAQGVPLDYEEELHRAVTKHWNSLSREDVESPSLEVIHNSPPPFAPHHLKFLAVRSICLKCLNSEKEVRPWIKQITHWHIPHPKSLVTLDLGNHLHISRQKVLDSTVWQLFIQIYMNTELGG